MKNYTKTYLKHFGYGADSFIPCEICGTRAVDIHHIKARSVARELVNDITNLMAICRKHHEEYGDKKEHIEFLQTVHNNHL